MPLFVHDHYYSALPATALVNYALFFALASLLLLLYRFPRMTSYKSISGRGKTMPCPYYRMCRIFNLNVQVERFQNEKQSA